MHMRLQNYKTESSKGDSRPIIKKMTSKVTGVLYDSY